MNNDLQVISENDDETLMKVRNLLSTLIQIEHDCQRLIAQIEEIREENHDSLVAVIAAYECLKEGEKDDTGRENR